MKKICSLMLSLCLVVSLLMSPASAAGQTFRDVPLNHWAAPYIERAFDDGVINGTYYDVQSGARDYSPETQLTMAQFIVILTQAFYPEAVLTHATNYPSAKGWYVHHKEVALYYDLFAGTSGLDYLDSPISRYDMAAIMTNLLSEHGQGVEPAERSAVRARIGDWNAIPEKYQYAVATVFSLGVITGTDSKGTFSGRNYMTRAQAAVIYCRLRDAINGTVSPVVKPVEKPAEKPAETAPVVPVDVFDFKFSDYGTAQAFADAVNAATPAYREGYLTNGKPITDDNIQEFLSEIKRILPAGMEWDEQSKYRYQSPKFGGGRGCYSFAALVSDWMFGEDAPLIKHQNFTEIKPGDAIYGKNVSGSYHHIYVIRTVEYDLTEKDYYIQACDGNRNDEVCWDVFGWMSSYIHNVDGFGDLSYVYSRY